MAVRVGGMYGRKRTFGYPKSYGSEAKRREQPPVRRTEKVSALLSAKVTKPVRRIRR